MIVLATISVGLSLPLLFAIASSSAWTSWPSTGPITFQP